MTAPLLLDTGGWLNALAGEEPWASAVEEAGDLIVPGLVLAEGPGVRRIPLRAADGG